MVFVSVESAHEVNGTSEGNITVRFTLQDPVVNKITDKPSLYKDGGKIGSCRQDSPCKEKFAFIEMENRTVTLHITNLTLEDEGTYYVVVYSDGANPLIESNRIDIKVILGNTTTGTYILCAVAIVIVGLHFYMRKINVLAIVILIRLNKCCIPF